MGMFAEVAGWLSLDEEHLTKAQGIINADLDGVGYYAEAFSVDRDFTDCPSGLFPVEYESEGAPEELWQVSGSALRVERSE